MGKDSDLLPESPSMKELRRTVEDPRVPWWASWLLKAIMIVGIPGALLGSREYRDFRYEGERIEVERQRIAVEEKRNVTFDRLVGVLYKLERKLGPDPIGGVDR